MGDPGRQAAAGVDPARVRRAQGKAETDPVAKGVDKTIYESATTLVKRSQWDGQPVIIKALKPSARNAGSIARYHHEFKINQSLTSPYVCRALVMDDSEHRIIFEDCSGRALRELIQADALSLD